MSRPTRTEVLQALDAIGVPEDVWTESQGIIRDAARAYAGLAPDTCPCPGCDFGHHISAGGGGSRCSKCVGGYVWPDQLVAKMAQAYAEAEGFISPSDDAHVAMREALGALWEVWQQ